MYTVIVYLSGLTAIFLLGWTLYQLKPKPIFQKLSFIGFSLVAVLFVVVAFASKDLYSAWMQEDNWVEWGTFYIFLGAGVFNAWYAVNSLKGKPWDISSIIPIIGCLGLIGFCVFVAGEEISWAQRIFAYKPPDIFLEENFQQELNIHNLLKGKDLAGFKLETKYLIAVIAVVYGIIIPLGYPCLPDFPLKKEIKPFIPSFYLAPWFAVIAWAELAYPISLTGEAAEFFLGLVFFTDAFQRWQGEKSPDQWKYYFKSFLPILAGITVLAILTPPVFQYMVYGSNEELNEKTKSELKMLTNDLFMGGAMKSKMFKKSSIHKRLFTAVRKKYLRFGKGNTFLENQGTCADSENELPVRKDRKGYFLDPWNNPYWIFYRRNPRLIIIYSFGPNRRRDSKIKKVDSDLSGDDIGIIIKKVK